MVWAKGDSSCREHNHHLYWTRKGRFKWYMKSNNQPHKATETFPLWTSRCGRNYLMELVWSVKSYCYVIKTWQQQSAGVIREPTWPKRKEKTGYKWKMLRNKNNASLQLYFIQLGCAGATVVVFSISRTAVKFNQYCFAYRYAVVLSCNFSNNTPTLNTMTKWIWSRKSYHSNSDTVESSCLSNIKSWWTFLIWQDVTNWNIWAKAQTVLKWGE